MSRIKILIGVITLAFASHGQAFVLDFQDLADNALGESAWQPLSVNFSEGGFAGTLTISGQNAAGDAFAYLDASIGANRAGLGVCPKLLAGETTGARPGLASNICDPSDDDNIRIAEELTFAINITLSPPGLIWTGVEIAKLWISSTHDGDGDVAGDTIAVNGASQALAGNGWYTGTPAEVANWVAGPALAPGDDLTVGFGGDRPEQFYVSAMEIVVTGRPLPCQPGDPDCTVPVVGVLPLLGIGLLSMLLINRRCLYS